mmetsp:Transcript_52025/g.120908  ORF Transcript_52025/g.120908 Transcript_52025/m.120908 type:complete len:202 (+) Transcript_52025:85-690(+)
MLALYGVSSQRDSPENSGLAAASCSLAARFCANCDASNGGSAASCRPAMPAPRPKSRWQTASRPASAAATRGVQSCALTASMGAPCARRSSQMSAWPARAARCRGVSSQLSGSSTKAPCSSSFLTTVMEPPLLAACSTVQPHKSAPVMGVALWINASQRSVSPARAACIRPAQLPASLPAFHWRHRLRPSITRPSTSTSRR